MVPVIGEPCLGVSCHWFLFLRFEGYTLFLPDVSMFDFVFVLDGMQTTEAMVTGDQ